jgi:DNA adenine methylase
MRTPFTIDISLKRLGNFSPLRYPGGKAPLAGFLDRVIKAQRLHGSVYIEPYAGGAGAALSLLFLEKVERIVINDLDPAIYAFWVAVTQETDWFIKRINKVEVSVEEWAKQRKVYLNESKNGTKELGFALFYLNRTNRSGILSGWPIGGIDQGGKWKIDARFNRSTLADRVRRIGLYSSRIEVKNQDGLSLAKKYLQKQSGLIYLDPPYFRKGKSLYLNHFDDRQHEQLAECLNAFPRASWVLTYDNVPEIRSLYERRKIVQFALAYSAHSSRVGSEIMIPSDTVARALMASQFR